MAHPSRHQHPQQKSQSLPTDQGGASSHKHYHLSVHIIASIAALGGLLFGYDSGLILGAELLLKKDFALNPITEEVAISAILVGGIVGAAISGKLSNAIGRKKSLIVVAIIFAIGAILTAIAPNLAFFVAFRILVGFSVGIASMVAPIYISEMAPSSERGALVNFNKLALSIATPLAYWIGLALAHANLGWRPMFGVECVPGIAFAIGMFFLPESPRWLASKGHWDEAEQVVESVAGVEHEEEMRAIRKSLAKGKHASIRELFFTGLCLALAVGVGLAVFQQFVGIAAISYYAPTIFKFAGFQSASGDVLATSITAIDTVIATIISIFLVDRLGRRPLLLASLLGIIITLVIISTAFAMGANKAGYLILISLLIYVLAYGLGIGPLFALICSEIFPTKLRGTAVSISLCVNWIATLLISITFLSLVKHLGEAWTFSVYAFFAVAGLIFTWFLVPETKGKKLEQIEEYWEHGRHW